MILAVLAGLLAFLYRYLAHTNFNNDHFAHLSRSQAWLAGDWPIRDYTDPGSLLLIGLSAGAQLLLGRTLLSELLPTRVSSRWRGASRSLPGWSPPACSRS